MATKKIWAKRVEKPLGCKCLICNTDRVDAIEGSHLVSQKILNLIPDIRKEFYNYDGFNVVWLCGTCHTLFDKGSLTLEEAQRILPKLRAALLELAIHLTDNIDDQLANELEAFLSKHNYERRNTNQTKQSQRTEESN